MGPWLRWLMSWGKKQIAGTVYDLTHLNSFIVTCPGGPAGARKIRVEFGSHTFTKKWNDAYAVDLKVMDGKTPRAFCLERYAHSLRIKVAVQQAIKGVVFNDAGRPAISARLPGLEGPYLIAFQLRRSKSPHFECVMNVVSSHHRPAFNEALPQAKFTVLVDAAITGRPVRWTKK